MIAATRLFPTSLTMVEHIFSCVSYPLLRVQRVIVDRVIYYSQRQKDLTELRQLVCDLNNKCELLRAENIELQALSTYAHDIKELDEFRKQYTYSGESRIVQILLRSLSPREHYILVDAGRNRGITRDMVAVYKNCLVGKVEHVYSWYSKVRLITDESCKVAVFCAKSRANGIYQGCNECDRALLQYVPHFENLVVQETLITSGEGMLFPKGLSVGSIESYEKNGLYCAVRTKPHIDVRSLPYCVLLSR